MNTLRKKYEAFCPKCKCVTTWDEDYRYEVGGGARAHCKRCRTRFDADGFCGNGVLRYNDGEYLYTTERVIQMRTEYEKSRK